eukprot:7362724-Lingulodinium_polyedra.AAC.1
MASPLPPDRQNHRGTVPRSSTRDELQCPHCRTQCAAMLRRHPGRGHELVHLAHATLLVAKIGVARVPH